ncbi:MAG: DUF402 domain-containing protein [Gemmatimonadetes bacterium]|nr:DUF402 domain-containing protein [Gemmatimonadota bacterium]
MSRLIQYTYSRPGKGSERYEHWLVADKPDVKILLMTDYRGKPLMIDGKVAVEPGSALLWFVFPGAWHDIGRFHLADDTLTGWYTNLCTPVEMRGDSWASTDLFLDHWMTPDGSQSWLDEDELADAIGAGLVSQETQTKVEEERRSIQACLDTAGWPPQVALDMDLHRARGLMGK